ncbi:MAG TPA: sigma factor [Thermoleophilaceae bacterium]|nr:sigma factor [Thermoleophilaceae bacterium]
MNRSRRPGGRRASVRAPRRLLSLSSDDRLVERVIDGDDTAFELLYARHVADALAFAAGVLGSQEEAEEAVRHSFAAAHAYLAGGGRRTAFEPWLYAILENHCLSELKRRAPEPDGPERLATVVDLDDWRRRRKLIGVGLPFVPSAAFHDSVMSACGIGAGTAAAATPLLGGTLAKVAVVAVLAGGAGVAGTTASDGGDTGSDRAASGSARPLDIEDRPSASGASALSSLSSDPVPKLGDRPACQTRSRARRRVLRRRSSRQLSIFRGCSSRRPSSCPTRASCPSSWMMGA